MTRGYCVDMVSGREYEINDVERLDGKTWWDMRPTNIQMPASTWTDLKKYIIKTCKRFKNCDKEVATWERSLKNLSEKIEKVEGK